MSIVFTYFVPSTPNDGFSMWEKNLKPQIWMIFFLNLQLAITFLCPVFWVVFETPCFQPWKSFGNKNLRNNETTPRGIRMERTSGDFLSAIFHGCYGNVVFGDLFQWISIYEGEMDHPLTKMYVG